MRVERRYAVIIALALAATSCNAVLGPSKRDANWNVIETPRFSLHVRPNSFAEQNAARIGDVLEDQYDVTLRMLGASYSGHITAMLYASGAEASLPSDRSGTAFPATGAFEAGCTPPMDDDLMSLLAHEANHVIQQNALGSPGTYMLNEGLASAVLSEKYHWRGRHFYYTWIRDHRSQMVPISQLADDKQWSKFDEHVAYSASAAFLGYLLETAGPAKLKELYLVNSPEFERRFQEIYGRSLGSVEAEWLAFCERQ
jgi:hypothetical protein